MDDQITGNERPLRAAPLHRADLNLHELDGEAVLYDPRSGAVHRFDAMTMIVWQACDGSRTASQIAAVLTERYGIDVDEALAHVERVLMEFRERGLLEGGAEGSGIESLDDAQSATQEAASAPAALSRRTLLRGGAAKLLLAAPAISTFFAADAYPAASNPINPGFSPVCGAGKANPGYSCTTNQDCCSDLFDNIMCEPARMVCCVKNNVGPCYRDEDCCTGGTCSGGICRN